MGALQYVDCPGYAAILFRRTFADLALPGALMDRAHEWLQGTAAQWVAQEKTWRFPSGASVSFGYLETENDKYRYQSSEFQYIGFDELTQFAESQYRYLFSRLRRTGQVQAPLRQRAGSNPGGTGHEWVKLRYVDPPNPERPFIPARLDDNPYLDQTGYIDSLNQLDAVTRAQLLEGDWTARPAGAKFRREWFEIRDAAPANMSLCRYWDLAATEPKPGTDPDWTAGALVGRTTDGTYGILDIRRLRGTPQTVERVIRQTAQIDRERYGFGVMVRMEQEPGASGVAGIDYYRRSVLQMYDFRGIKVSGPKEVRANPLSAQAEAGNVWLLRGAWIQDWLDEAEAFPGGAHDDQVDAASGAYQEVAAHQPVRIFSLDEWAEAE